VTNFYRDIALLQLTLPQRRLLIWLYERVGTSTQGVGFMIGGGAIDNPAYVRVFVSKIRRKLKGSGWAISFNNRGGGYKVEREA
jgi:hypothetical protein